MTALPSTGRRILIVLAIAGTFGFAAWATSLIGIGDLAGTLHERPLLLTVLAFAIGILAGVTALREETPQPFWRRALPIFWFCILIGLHRIVIAQWWADVALEIVAAGTTAALMTLALEPLRRLMQPTIPARSDPE